MPQLSLRLAHDMKMLVGRLQLKANYFVRLKNVFIIETKRWKMDMVGTIIDYRLRNGTIYNLH
jgi:hypothetical protein